MSKVVLQGSINVVTKDTKPNGEPLFDGDETVHIHIDDISQVPKSSTAQEHPKSSGSILLGETTINLAREKKFPVEFQCEYDPTKASNGQFDKLCEKGLIVVGAEVDSPGREMTTLWLKSGPKKFEQNIKLIITDFY